MIKRNNKKKYIHIDREPGSNEIFTMLDKFESDTESDIENLLGNFDTEYIVELPVVDNKEESHQILIPKATVHVEGEVLDINGPPAKKIKKKVAELMWKRTSKFVKAKKCTLEANVLLNIQENANPLLIYELVKHICHRTYLYVTQNGRAVATNPEDIRAFLGINYIV